GNGVGGGGLAGPSRRHELVHAREAAASRAAPCRRRLTDQRPPLDVVVGGEKEIERHFAVSVESVAIRERQLRALRHDVDELRLAELGEVEGLEQCELLQADGARGPGLWL